MFYVAVIMLWIIIACLKNESVLYATRLTLAITVLYTSLYINQFSLIDHTSRGVLSEDADDTDLNVLYDYWPLLYDNIFHILTQLGLALVYDRLVTAISSPLIWE